MQIPIDQLPISKLQKQRIEEYTYIRSISDLFALADPQTELMKAPRIGKIVSQKIIEKAKATTTEFLA